MAAPTVVRTASGSSTGTSVTISTLLVDGSDTLLMVMAGVGANTTRDISSVTHNGDGCTELSASAGSIFNKAELWYRKSPDAGTFDVVVTATTTGGAETMGVGVTLVNGAHQTDTFGTPTANEATNTSNTIDVASAVDELVISGTATDDETGITAGDTQLWKVEGVAGDCSYGGMSQDGAASVTMNWTQDITGWSSAGVSIKSAEEPRRWILGPH